MKGAALRDYAIALSQTAFDDLRDRLSRYRAPPRVDEAGWRMGIDVEYLGDLIQYWRTQFDWHALERRLNRFRHYLVSLPFADTPSDIHVVVEPGSGANPTPLLLGAGWPSSFIEFDKVIDALAHPERHGGDAEQSFTVIVPDLPGFGLSPAPPRPIPPRQIADAWRVLLVDVLGHDRCIVHGSDWGAVVGSWLALDHPACLSGLHLSMLGLRPALTTRDSVLSDAEKHWLTVTRQRLEQDGGYREIQATKPNTAAIGLSDSPAAAAAWIIEKYHGWSDGGAAAVPPFDRDELLGAATLYWITNSLPSANWIYWADRHAADTGLSPGKRVEVPTGLALFDGGFFPPPPVEWTQRIYNVVHRVEHPVGGHFPAWRAPDDFIRSVRDFARVLKR